MPNFAEQLGIGFATGALTGLAGQFNRTREENRQQKQALRNAALKNPTLFSKDQLVSMGFSEAEATSISTAPERRLQQTQQLIQGISGGAGQPSDLKRSVTVNTGTGSASVSLSERSPRESAQRNFQSIRKDLIAQGMSPREAAAQAAIQDPLGAPDRLITEAFATGLRPEDRRAASELGVDINKLGPEGKKLLFQRGNQIAAEQAATTAAATEEATIRARAGQAGNLGTIAQQQALGSRSGAIQAEAANLGTLGNIAATETAARTGARIGAEVQLAEPQLQVQARSQAVLQRQKDLQAQIAETREALGQSSQSKALLRNLIADVRSKIPAASPTALAGLTLNQLKAELKIDAPLDTFNQISQTLSLQMARVIDPSGRVSDQDRQVASGFVPQISDPIEVVDAKLSALDAMEIMRTRIAQQQQEAIAAGTEPTTQRIDSSIFPPDSRLQQLFPGFGVDAAKLAFLQQQYGISIPSAAAAEQLLDILDAFRVPAQF